MSHSSESTRLRAVRIVAPLLLAFVALIACARAAQAQNLGQTVIPGPDGSEAFGAQVTVLTNGNFVVTDPFNDAPFADDAGAVDLYDGATLALISRLAGSTTNDQVGSGGVTALTNGNYVVSSPNWDNGAALNAGAVTWVNGTTGISGTVSAVNSLVGSTADDNVGGSGVTALTNGNYVVASPDWDNGGEPNAGAVTWGNGATGVSGAISATNSLVGTSEGDFVGNGGVTELTNGNYVVGSPDWHNFGISYGAATWGSGTTGVSGAVSPTNSLVGTEDGDRVGDDRSVTPLTNGNYVVASPDWHNGGEPNAGAVTWGNGATGVSGAVSASNSLVGTSEEDYVGNGGVTELTNGNYVVGSPDWDNGGTVDVGAATWGSGTTGINGAVSAFNSLVGTSESDRVGDYLSVTQLTNGNYVVASPFWDNDDTVDAGAVTWGSGATGILGAVSASNSLVGSTAGDQVGTRYSVTSLTNGNYVVASPDWDNGGTVDVGAVTWGSGATGVSGTVSATNSLVGSTTFDDVGYGGVTALTNGNFVVASPGWDTGGAADAGAVTWSSGTTGIVGTVSSSNSLIGSRADDQVGIGGVTALTNGNYVVASPKWDNGGTGDAGAVTWGGGTTGISGAVSVSNSLVGSMTDDSVGLHGVLALTNGNYVVITTQWDNVAAVDAGAVTWGSGTTGVSGAVSASNSLVGSTASDYVGGEVASHNVTALTNGDYVVNSRFWNNGAEVDAGAITLGNGKIGSFGAVTTSNSVPGQADTNGQIAFNPLHDYLVVGLPADNKVIVAAFAAPYVYLPSVSK